MLYNCNNDRVEFEHVLLKSTVQDERVPNERGEKDDDVECSPAVANWSALDRELCVVGRREHLC